MADLATVADSKLTLNLHAGQKRAWQSDARFVLMLAGTQGGKTSFGPHLLYREIQRRGAGDYLVVTPTFQLLEKKCLPEFLRVFRHWLKLGRYVASPSRVFTFSDAGARRTFGKFDAVNDPQTRVLFGYADDPESLESATAKCAWLDEAGQKRFRVGAWEAIQRRLSIHQGRAFLTTTPYSLNWLKADFVDRWEQGDKDYDVIRFDSAENPSFPRVEFERAARTLPRWKFDMMYRAQFTRPAGLIYDCFDRAAHAVKRVPLAPTWRRILGLDFGAVNLVGVLFAEEPETRRLYLERVYRAGGRTAREHVENLRAYGRIDLAVGGAASEQQWRDEFASAGLVVREPKVRDVEVGINRVYGLIAQNRFCVFDDLIDALDELATYARALDARGEPTEDIEDKSDYHILDAVRYAVSEATIEPLDAAGAVVTFAPVRRERSRF